MKSIIFLFLACVVFAGEHIIPLDGQWQFKTDLNDTGIKETQNFLNDETGWRNVQVPHTWQVDPGLENYYGIAWYKRSVTLPQMIVGKTLQLEFDAIYRDAIVFVNGLKVGRHFGSGWTPFDFTLKNIDIKELVVAVRVDNRFSKQALPYDHSFDWAADGGIIRSARLRALPSPAVNDLYVNAVLSDEMDRATVNAIVRLVKNSKDFDVTASIFDPSHNCLVQQTKTPDSASDSVDFQFKIKSPVLWHFDKPKLYTMQVDLYKNGERVHSKTTQFGVRSVKVEDGYYWLNGEPMRLMGVEWMPGSDPRYGMAQSPEDMRQVLRDMKKLNCVITRFHWQQDKAVFDFCDEHGMLVQEEVPTWGGQTQLEEVGDIQAMQMNEMIRAHYNHPSIYAWGLCNEISGHGPAGHTFVKNGIDIARRLDPTRLLTYASNHLQKNPERDASQFVDFIEWNDYYESWFGGDLDDLNQNLRAIQDAYPNKSLVISEYGLCECSPDNPVGDERRIEILKTHTDQFRRFDNIAGAIFFDYNDYRTHIGDKGEDEYQQRVHGVVDLLGRRKPSWDVLRREMSPIKTIVLEEYVNLDSLTVIKTTITTRSLKNDMPAYTLSAYDLVWTAFNTDNQPMQGGTMVLPDLPPGSSHSLQLAWPQFENLEKVYVEIFRPTGYSVISREWFHPE